MILALYSILPDLPAKPNLTSEIVEDSEGIKSSAFLQLGKAGKDDLKFFFLVTEFEAHGEIGYRSKIPDALVSYATMAKGYGLDLADQLKRTGLAVKTNNGNWGFRNILTRKGDPLYASDSTFLLDKPCAVWSAVKHTFEKYSERCPA